MDGSVSGTYSGSWGVGNGPFGLAVDYDPETGVTSVTGAAWGAAVSITTDKTITVGAGFVLGRGYVKTTGIVGARLDYKDKIKVDVVAKVEIDSAFTSVTLETSKRAVEFDPTTPTPEARPLTPEEVVQ